MGASAAIVLSADAPMLEEAQRILDEAGLPYERIIALDRDSILYENRMHRARTAWVGRQPGTGRLRVRMVEGFPIAPPAEFRPAPL